MIPESVVFHPSLQHIDIRLYGALRSYRNESTKSRVFPSQSTLAKRIGCCRVTVHRSIKRLEALGFIEHRRGRNGQTSKYQFLTDSNTDATLAVALERLDSIKEATRVGTPVKHKPEPVNQNHKPEKAPRLYYGNDLASVLADGSIRLRIHTGAWVDYGGGDDDGFRFGDLRGVDARRAAVKRYSGQHGKNP